MYHFNEHDNSLPMSPKPIELVPKGYICRRRRQRITFTSDQLDKLEGTFNTTHFPDCEERRQLAEMFGLDEKRIQIWFKNRRAKFRNQQKYQKFKQIHLGSPAPRGRPPKDAQLRIYTEELSPTVYYSYEDTSSFADASAALVDQEFALRTASSVSSAADTSVNGSPQQSEMSLSFLSYPTTTYYTDLNVI